MRAPDVSRPIRLAKVAVTTIALVIAVVRFLAIDASSHSASDTIRPWSIEVLIIVAITWVAMALIERRRRL